MLLEYSMHFCAHCNTTVYSFYFCKILSKTKRITWGGREKFWNFAYFIDDLNEQENRGARRISRFDMIAEFHANQWASLFNETSWNSARVTGYRGIHALISTIAHLHWTRFLFFIIHVTRRINCRQILVIHTRALRRARRYAYFIYISFEAICITHYYGRYIIYSGSLIQP